jgi:hypothetical protein
MNSLFGLSILGAWLIRAVSDGNFGKYISMFSGGFAIPTATSNAGAVQGTSSTLSIPTLSPSLAGSGTVGSSAANSDILDTSFGGVPDGGDTLGSIVGDM